MIEFLISISIIIAFTLLITTLYDWTKYMFNHLPGVLSKEDLIYIKNYDIKNKK